MTFPNRKQFLTEISIVFILAFVVAIGGMVGVFYMLEP